MKYFYLLLVSSLTVYFNHANAQITFQKYLLGSGAHNTNVHDVKLLSNGGYIACGTEYTTVFGSSQDAFLVRLNQYGDTVWTRYYGNSTYDIFYEVIPTTDGGFAAVGRTNQGGNAETDIWLVKTDANGTISWTKRYGTNGYLDVGYCILQTPDGGFIITGDSDSNTSNQNLFLLKTEADGDIEWSKIFGRSTEDHSTLVRLCSDGGYLVAGETTTNYPQPDGYLIKFDALGNMLWNTYFGATLSEALWGLVELNDGTIMLTGITTSFGSGLSECMLVKVSATGSILWAKTYGGSAFDVPGPIDITTDGNIIFSGNTTSFAADGDYYLIKADTSGNILWSKTYGGSSADQVSGLVNTPDGGYMISGYSNSFGSGWQDGYFVKTDAMGLSGCEENDVVFTMANITMSTNTGYNEYGTLIQGSPIILSAPTGLIPGMQCFNINCLVDAAFTSTNAVCVGTTVAFTNTGQYAVNHQWKIDGLVFATTTNASYTFNNPGNYIITLISADGICIDSTQTTITVNPIENPSVTIANNTPLVICEGNCISFTASPLSGGNNHTYQWLINNNPVNNATDTTFTVCGPQDSDVISFVLTSGNFCANPIADTSNTLTIAVVPISVPTVTIVTDPQFPICPGTCVTVNALTTNLLPPSTLAWQLNGSPINGVGNTDEFTYCNFANGDVITVIASSTGECASPVAVIDDINVSIYPTPVAPTISTSGNVTLTSSLAEGIQWFMVGNTNSIDSSQSINVNTDGNYYLVYTDTNGCAVISDTVNVIIDGLIENGNTSVLSLYPNPTTGSITVETNALSAGKIQLEIRSVLGQVVFNLTDFAAGGLYRKTMPLNLNPGLYFITLQTNTGRLTKKIEVVR